METPKILGVACVGIPLPDGRRRDPQQGNVMARGDGPPSVGCHFPRGTSPWVTQRLSFSGNFIRRIWVKGILFKTRGPTHPAWRRFQGVPPKGKPPQWNHAVKRHFPKKISGTSRRNPNLRDIGGGGSPRPTNPPPPKELVKKKPEKHRGVVQASITIPFALNCTNTLVTSIATPSCATEA